MSLRRWTDAVPGILDLRDVEPPPGACLERLYRDGDPSTPCTLFADGHDHHEDPEGYGWYA